MPLLCAEVVCEEELLAACVKLLQVARVKVCGGGGGGGGEGKAGSEAAPKWLAPLFVLLDVWEKTASLAHWYRPPRKVHV